MEMQPVLWDFGGEIFGKCPHTRLSTNNWFYQELFMMMRHNILTINEIQPRSRNWRKTL